jgi:hypothetical protein
VRWIAIWVWTIKQFNISWEILQWSERPGKVQIFV